jgi:vacuolar-type H+-ATPase subunit E/Vma4
VGASVQNPQDVLCEEIRAEASRRAEDILRRAREEAASIRAWAATEAQNVREERLKQARGEGACWTELALAIVPVEAVRRRVARIEVLLQAIYDEARRRLAAGEGFDRRNVLVALAAEGLARMAGETFVVKMAAQDRASLGEGLADAIRSQAGRTPLTISLADDPAIAAGGGVIVQDCEGRQVWDARLLVRLDRLWPEVRQQLAANTGLVVSDGAAGGGA